MPWTRALTSSCSASGASRVARGPRTCSVPIASESTHGRSARRWGRGDGSIEQPSENDERTGRATVHVRGIRRAAGCLQSPTAHLPLVPLVLVVSSVPGRVSSRSWRIPDFLVPARAPSGTRARPMAHQSNLPRALLDHILRVATRIPHRRRCRNRLRRCHLRSFALSLPKSHPSRINLHFCVLIAYLVGHDPMGRNLLWDIEKLCSHARELALRTWRCAATRCVEGA